MPSFRHEDDDEQGRAAGLADSMREAMREAEQEVVFEEGMSSDEAMEPLIVSHHSSSKDVEAPSNNNNTDESDNASLAEVAADYQVMLKDEEDEHDSIMEGCAPVVGDYNDTLKKTSSETDSVHADEPAGGRDDISRTSSIRRSLTNMLHGAMDFIGEDDEEKNEPLPEDSFTFMFVACPYGMPFWSAIGLMVVQIGTFGLLVGSTVDVDNPDNILGLPANISPAVRVTQLVAIVITILTQDDIRAGIEMLNAKYLAAEFRAQFPYTSIYRWYFSIFMRIFEGAFGLMTTFVLIVSESTVINLLLNFTAMEL